MKLQISAITHPGLVRRKNEDNLCLCQQVLPEDKKEVSLKCKCTKPALLGVFDGMGGYLNGEKASFFAAETARNAYEEKKKLQSEDLLQICMDANQAVCDYMEEEAISCMGTTAAMLYFDDREVIVCNLGDSPIYQYRGGELRRIHQEHTERSLREALLGQTIPQSKKFKLTQYIGMPPDEIQIEPYLAKEEVQAGDCYLICSDGISDMVDDEQIKNVLAQEKKPGAVTKKLIALAMEAGGKDNATVIYVCISGFRSAKNTPSKKKAGKTE